LVLLSLFELESVKIVIKEKDGRGAERVGSVDGGKIPCISGEMGPV
jgi:hypothetical protein